MVDTLASPFLRGRGYIQNADEKAANLIATEFYKIGIQPFKKLDYYQQFHFSVNTFPGFIQVKADDKELIPGEQYIVGASCPAYKGSGKVVVCDSAIINKPKKLEKFLSKKYSKVFLLFNLKNVSDKEVVKKLRGVMATNALGAKGIIEVKDKLTMDISTEVGTFPTVEIISSALKRYPKTISLDIENKYISDYVGRNVMGYVKGTEQPDSFLVFTAHYDHLGMMGHDVVFTGANDNASGCAMMLTLAKYYAKNPAKYSIAFIGFGGEELGLLGSLNYVQRPAFPLEKIKFLTNLDILGTGDEGITVVNGSVFKPQFDTLVSINNRLNLLKEVKIRGKAANSDHYPFTEKGVPAFFIYTMGGIKAYHDVFDKRETLPLTEFPKLFVLLTEFVKTF
jgi:aminopeptidase YwaD